MRLNRLLVLVAAFPLMVAGATAGTTVTWYTAMNTQDAEPLRKRFEEKHPGTTLTVLRQPGEKIRNRIVTEARAGKNFWDVVSFNHLDMDVLDGEKLLAGRAEPIYVRQYTIGFNTNLVKPGEAPRDWGDLLQAKWKGKLAIDENEVEWYASMLDYMGRDKGTAFMRSLARQEPQFRRGHTLLSKLLLAGDFPLAIVHAAEMDEAKKSGAPVDWVRTLDPIVTSPSVIAVAARAPNPQGARQFVDFVLSDEGQRLIAAQGRVAARFVNASELKVYYVNPKLAREMERSEKEFNEIFRR
jgi:iron(III) transport system substrate-binding protein